jgi:hypothetical protein
VQLFPTLSDGDHRKQFCTYRGKLRYIIARSDHYFDLRDPPSNLRVQLISEWWWAKTKKQGILGRRDHGDSRAVIRSNQGFPIVLKYDKQFS